MRSGVGGATFALSRLGLKPIEELEVGDQVLTQDAETGALHFQPILTVAHGPPCTTLRVTAGEESIICSGIHRFWKVGQGWVMARDLRPGDPIRALGRAMRVRVSMSHPRRSTVCCARETAARKAEK